MRKARPKATSKSKAPLIEQGSSGVPDFGEVTLTGTSINRDFLSYGISSGDLLEKTELFPPDTYVLQLTQSEILLSNPALSSAVEVELSFSGRKIDLLQVQEGDPLVRTQGVSDLTFGGQIPTYDSEILSGTIINPQAVAYPIALNIPWDGILFQVSTMCSSGALDCSPRINDESVVERASFLKGSNLFLVLSNVSPKTTFHYTIYLAKSAVSM
jgi:hypothetical protein